MKRTIIGRALGTALIFGGMQQAAHADTWVFRDSLRPNGHDRSMAVKRADIRRCGASRGGYIADARAEAAKECMEAHGWTLDHVIPIFPRAYVRSPGYASPPPVDNSASDDLAQRQRDQAIQQSIIQQDQDFQRMQNEFQQQQQQMIENNR